MAGTPVRTPAALGGGRSQSHRTAQWARAKLLLRIFVTAAAVVTIIVALACIGAPRDSWSDWVAMSLLFALPYNILSLIWEAVEIANLRIRSKGLKSAAHLACELVLWMGGLSVGLVWIINTTDYQHHSFYTGEGSLSPAEIEVLDRWSAVIYFWGTVVLLMTICQFVLFVLSCIEVDRERKTRERRIDHIIEIMEERGQDPEAVLASFARAEEGNPYLTKPAWPVEMPAVNPDPVEMYVQERPLEMVGDLGAREMPVPGGDVNGNQKYVLRR